MEEELLMLLPGLISGIPSGLFGIAAYILTALAIYRISCRRGLNNPWLAWIPVVNCWILGSISDQYRYVAKGETKNKRKNAYTRLGELSYTKYRPRTTDVTEDIENAIAAVVAEITDLNHEIVELELRIKLLKAGA